MLKVCINLTSFVMTNLNYGDFEQIKHLLNIYKPLSSG